MTALAQVRHFARRIDAATPPQRDRAVDALRALAIAGVIGGHWLVTALVTGSSQHGTVLHDDSPLASMPWLAPVSWIFQTLAVFFLVGGYAAARSYRGGYLPWLRKRLIRLARPVAALVAVWIPVTIGMILAGVPATTVHTLLFLVISPLWFLGVYAGLTALTPLALWLVRRFGAAAVIFPVSLVAAADLLRFGLHGPGWVGWVNVAAGWLVPYLLGIAWALGSLRGRRGQRRQHGIHAQEPQRADDQEQHSVHGGSRDTRQQHADRDRDPDRDQGRGRTGEPDHALTQPREVPAAVAAGRRVAADQEEHRERLEDPGHRGQPRHRGQRAVVVQHRPVLTAAGHQCGD